MREGGVIPVKGLRKRTATMRSEGGKVKVDGDGMTMTKSGAWTV
jgi:hypothetical protein